MRRKPAAALSAAALSAAAGRMLLSLAAAAGIGVAPAILLGGCVRQADLTYTPPPAPHPLPLAIGRVIVTDERPVPPQTVGAVMGVDGTPLKVLTAAPDAAGAVRRAFQAALAARGALAANPMQARTDLIVWLLDLRGQQYVLRQAEVDLLVQLVDRRTGRELYSGRFYAEQRQGSFLMLDYQLSAPPSALGAVTAQTLTEAIDRALDRAGLALAARG